MRRYPHANKLRCRRFSLTPCLVPFVLGTPEIANAHNTNLFEKTYRFQKMRRYPQVLYYCPILPINNEQSLSCHPVNLLSVGFFHYLINFTVFLLALLNFVQGGSKQGRRTFGVSYEDCYAREISRFVCNIY